MSVGLGDGRWLLPLRLAVVSMIVTVALIAAAGVAWLGLSLGAAILLGGILAPTDPVLAADVQVAEPTDRDRLRFSLTGEAGLNDGTAFPFVLLGLGLLGLHDLGASLWRWLAVDVLWGVGAGIDIGAALGTLVGRFVLYLRRTHKEAVGLDNFLALGLIGITYGLASWPHGYGFLAVFAAGVALRRTRAAGQRRAAQTAGAAATCGRQAPSRRRRKRSAEAAAVAHADPDASQREQVATDPEPRAGLHGARDAELQRADRAHRRGRRRDRGRHAALGGRLEQRARGAFVAVLLLVDPAGSRCCSAWRARRRRARSAA